MMARNVTIVLPAEIGTEAAEEARTKACSFARAARAALAASGRGLCAVMTDYAEGAAAARVAPFDVLSGAARKNGKRSG